MLLLLIGIIVSNIIAEAFHLTLFAWILNYMKYLWLFYLVLFFQPEFKMVLTKISNLKIFSFIMKSAVSEEERYINEVTDAVFEMSAKRIGALIVFERNNDLTTHIENEVKIDAIITKELLITIFSLNTPLHDGAVIIRKGRLYAARAVLPINEVKEDALSKEYGTRHRAAVSITDVTDSVVVVVSEETKMVSIAFNGRLEKTNISKEELLEQLHAFFVKIATKEDDISIAYKKKEAIKNEKT